MVRKSGRQPPRRPFFHRRNRGAPLALLTAMLCWQVPGHAESGPQPPCAGEPFPPFPNAAGSPVVKVWNQSDWTPPACIGWEASPASTLVVTAGRFRHTSGVDPLRHRFGAASEMAGILYWSTTGKRWQPLIVEAYAVAGPSGDQRRKDFSLDETVEGRNLYMQQEDNLMGKAVYRIRIATASADRLVVASENNSTIKYMGVPLFPPGELQSICFLERESNNVWRYYSIARMGKQVSLLTLGHDASLINRAVASYRYLAGIPTDQEPPASR
jgi:hypothetical protein